MMLNYIIQSDIANYLQRDLSDGENNTLTVLIPAIQKFINNYTNRLFFVSVADIPTTTVYYSGGYRELFIDDLQTLVDVEYINEMGTITYTYVLNGNYYVTPRTGVINSLISIGGIWPHGVANIKVTGQFGTLVTPDLKMAGVMIAGELLKNPSSLKSESIERDATVFSSLISESPLIQTALDNNSRILL